MQKNLIVLLSSLWLHLESRRRKQFVLLLILTLLGAFSEVISLGAVIPFLGALTNPEKLFAQPYIANISTVIGINDSEQLVLPLTIIFIAAALLAAAFRLLLLWAKNRLVYASGTDLCANVYRRTLYQPYNVHLTRNSSEVISSITAKVSGVIGILDQITVLISSIVLMIFIVVVLIAINPLVAIVTFICFGLAYYLIAWSLRRKLIHNGHLIAEGRTEVIKTLQEGLGGIRDITLDGTQQMYCEVHRNAEYSLRRAIGNNNFIAGSPRFIIDATGMILIAILAYTLSRQTEGFASAIPMLGALALGATRLIPTLQQSYSAWSNIVGSQASLIDVLQLLKQEIPKEYTNLVVTPLPFRYAISFDKIYFKYAKKGPWVLNNLNLTIQKGSRIGFVGNTGCGKSTTLDLLMGLLKPSKGQILIDGLSLTDERRRPWQQIIAHVPQSIYLSDNTLAENIAFGTPLGDIDIERVKLAAKQANISEFIENKPNSYQELVGERGVRLSGGQRQRIGIARALYKKAKVLIFDEATSALDNSTEKSIMEAIDMLSRDLTIIIIAHRLTTVAHCDVIFELDKGRVVAQGRYHELLENSPSFREMANITRATS